MKNVAIPMEELVQILKLQLESAGVARLVVSGSSMQPMLRHRKDAVELAPVTQTLKIGDLILYRRENGKYVLHRILRAKGEDLVCCGDNQYRTEKVSARQVLAIVTAFTHRGKTYLVTDKGYRRYVTLWVSLHPLRWAYLGPRRVLGHIRRAIQRRKSVTSR